MRKANIPLLALLLALGAAGLLGMLTQGGAPPALAGVPPEPSPTRTRRPTGPPHPTAMRTPASTRTPAPTRPPTPSPTGWPTATPSPTAEPGAPTETPLPPHEQVVDVVWPVPPEPPPAPWVGVVDYLLGNVCAEYKGTTVCQGEWIVNTNPSLYEDISKRTDDLPANLVLLGDMRPTEPDDDVYISRPQCLVNGEWMYAPGIWYHNGLSEVRVEDEPFDTKIVHYGPPTYPVEFDVLVRYHRAYVPEPAYSEDTAWNFGAHGTCEGVGDGGEPPPTPPPPPTPTPPPAECPACELVLSPEGTLESPYLSPWQRITLTWNCDYSPEAPPVGYVLRAWGYDGQDWVTVAREEFSPEAPRRATHDIVSGWLYHARVQALFEVQGQGVACCDDETYYRHALLLPTPVGAPEARLDYYSEHDRDPTRGPDHPYRSSGPAIRWNYGEFLHAHPSAEWSHPEVPGWDGRTDVRRWKYLGSWIDGALRQARCADRTDPSCGWQEEVPGEPVYIHLRWFKNLMRGEVENEARGDRTWVYATEPQTVGLVYALEAETTWTHRETGYTVTWPAFTTTLTVTVDLKYLSTFRGGR